MDPVVYLVPVGRDRFELYSEPRDDGEVRDANGGTFDRWSQRMRQRWQDAVERARDAGAPGGIAARMRDWVVCRVADTLAEQRTLRSLRGHTSVDLVYPAHLEDETAVAAARGLLAHARWHHGLWLVIDTVLFVASGVFMLVPGPNLIAYYFAFRVVAHFLAWRGATNGVTRVVWHPRAEAALSELAQLAGAPRAARAPRVEAIASVLNVPQLAAFFDRVAG